MKINIIKGKAYLDENGYDCDVSYGKCDPFIKIFIDGDRVFESEEIENNDEPQFGINFVT